MSNETTPNINLPKKSKWLKAKLETARQNSMLDELTGLPNRKFFNRELQVRIKEKQREGKDFYLLFMDVDDFKVMNEHYTHAGGDRILRAFRAVNEKTRPREGVIRLGGDEFVQFVDADTPEEKLLELALRNQRIFQEETGSIMRVMSPNPEINTEKLVKKGDISIGIVRYQDGMDDESLIRLSSLALLRAKITESHIAKTDDGLVYQELLKAA